MSAGGVFKLIANDGKADRMIMATKLLNQRIKDIMCARRDAGKADITPTLVDIEKTHILFINAHFKPYAAIGYEYNKVRPQSGNPSLGNTITYSIPQFGDFFHDMVGHHTLSACQSNLQAAPAQGVPGFPADGFDWDNVTELTAAPTSVASASYSLVDPFGREVTPESGTFRNLVRYCEYPGERLYQNVKFDVNGNPLDEYNHTTATLIRKFTIGADKIVGYKRLVGQEVASAGFSGPKLCTTADSQSTLAPPVTTFNTQNKNVPTIPQHSVTPASTTMSAFIARGFPDNTWDSTLSNAIDHSPLSGANAYGYQTIVREESACVDGPQTPKYQQPILDLWVPLKFWFNQDPRLAIPSVSIPFGQRFISTELAPQNMLVSEEPGLYVKQTIDSGAVTGPPAAVNKRTITYRPWVSPGTISDISLSRVELYVNNIFVNPEVHDIYIKRIGFTLIRVYRQQRSTTNAEGHDEQLLSQLKWPIEYMYLALRPSWNISDMNPKQWRDWHKMSKVNEVVSTDYTYSETPLDDKGALAAGTLGYQSSVGKIAPTTWAKELKTVDNISLHAHGVPIHDNFPLPFFNAYVPYHYGSSAIITPNDEGVFMINFALYPRSYQPSGHLNISRAREFFISWSSRYVSSTTPAELLVVAIAINFLLITDGSAVLRYST